MPIRLYDDVNGLIADVNSEGRVQSFPMAKFAILVNTCPRVSVHLMRNDLVETRIGRVEITLGELSMVTIDGVDLDSPINSPYHCSTRMAVPKIALYPYTSAQVHPMGFAHIIVPWIVDTVFAFHLQRD